MQALRRYRQRYEYDAVGNIERMVHLPLQPGATGWTRRYAYAPDSNRLLATSAPGDAADTLSHAYPHDAAGNMTAMPHLAAMRLDHADRLQHADRQGGGGVYFTYDAGGQRVRKAYEHGAFVEERIYLGDFELYRKRHAGTATIELERETLHVADDQRRIALVETKTADTDVPAFSPSTRLRFQFDNHLGSSVLELDRNARVITYEEYTPFGGTAFHAAHSASEVSAKRYRYTGMERDEETGLAHHGARYYAPWLGRWISWDPAGLADGTNGFRYVHNRPLALTDLSGTEGRPPGLLRGTHTETTSTVPIEGPLGSGRPKLQTYVERRTEVTVAFAGMQLTSATLGWEVIPPPPNLQEPGNLSAGEPRFQVDPEPPQKRTRGSAPEVLVDRLDFVEIEEGPSKKKSPLTRALDKIQLGLDLLSLALDASGVGAAVSWVPDLMNAGISLGRRDWTGAGISLAATLPFIGAAANASRVAKAEAKFFHGATDSGARSIMEHGIKPVSKSTAPYPQGSFFAHDASVRNALEGASHWPVVQGKASSSGVRVVEMTVPAEVIRSMRAQGLIRTGAPAGLRGFPEETVFLPEALDWLNKFATFRIVPASF
jgi:RHS repeat-associated protein